MTHTPGCASQGFTGGQGLEFIPCDCGAALRRACEFQIEKNHVLTQIYLSHATTAEAEAIETLLCTIVNQFLDEVFSGWREYGRRS